MKNKDIPALLGALGSIALCWSVIHFWGAAWLSEHSPFSEQMIYRYFVTFLIIFQGWRIIQIIRGKDEVTKMVNRWFKGE